MNDDVNELVRQWETEHGQRILDIARKEGIVIRL